MIEAQITTRIMSNDVRSKCISKIKEVGLYQNLNQITEMLQTSNQLEYKDCEIRKVFYRKDEFEFVKPVATLIKIRRNRNKKKLKENNNSSNNN